MSQYHQLSNGIQMPAIGFGTYPMVGQQLTDAIYHAYNAGFRLFDTADNYYNEEDLGNALKSLYNTTKAKREELFLVTKISDELYKPGTLGGGSNKGIYFWKNSPVMQTPDAVANIVRQKVENSLKYLQTDYIDLLLMHWPYPDFFVEIWKEMEKHYAEGKIKAIGVCNCRERHFEKLKKHCHIQPMVNQFESSPVNTKVSLVNYCNENNIRVMIYSPLKNLKRPAHPRYQEYLNVLATKYGKTISQIVLRFDVQRGLVPIPKSTRKERIEENYNIFDFQLTEEEMSGLLNLNENRQYMPESKSCPGL